MEAYLLKGKETFKVFRHFKVLSDFMGKEYKEYNALCRLVSLVIYMRQGKKDHKH